MKKFIINALDLGHYILGAMFGGRAFIERHPECF